MRSSSCQGFLMKSLVVLAAIATVRKSSYIRTCRINFTCVWRSRQQKKFSHKNTLDPHEENDDCMKLARFVQPSFTVHYQQDPDIGKELNKSMTEKDTALAGLIGLGLSSALWLLTSWRLIFHTLIRRDWDSNNHGAPRQRKWMTHRRVFHGLLW